MARIEHSGIACVLWLAGCFEGVHSAPRLASTDASVEAAPDAASDATLPGERSLCSWTSCGALAQQIEVAGSSPYGVVHITRVSASYVQGFTNHTTVGLEGTLAGETLQINLIPYSDVVPDPSWVAEPGSYEGDSRYVGLSASAVMRNGAGECVYLELSGAVIEIDEHVVPDQLRPGVTSKLRGRVALDEQGWSLAVDFDIEVVCDRSTSV